MKKSKKVKLNNKKKKLDLSGDDPVNQDFSYFLKNMEWKKFHEEFEFKPKNKTITLRIPESMLENIKLIAEKENTDYQKLVRKALSDLIAKNLKKVA